MKQSYLLTIQDLSSESQCQVPSALKRKKETAFWHYMAITCKPYTVVISSVTEKVKVT